MELKHIDIACLSISPANMRGVKKAPDLTNILPSVRARGVLVPLIVRQNGSPTTYEIVAGMRGADGWTSRTPPRATSPTMICLSSSIRRN